MIMWTVRIHLRACTTCAKHLVSPYMANARRPPTESAVVVVRPYACCSIVLVTVTRAPQHNITRSPAATA